MARGDVSSVLRKFWVTEYGLELPTEYYDYSDQTSDEEIHQQNWGYITAAADHIDAVEAERDALAAENVRLGHYAILLEGALLRYCAGAYKDIDNAKTISGVDWAAMHVADIERRRTEALKGADCKQVRSIAFAGSVGD